MMNTTITKCTNADIDTIQALSCKAFRDAFGHLNSKENLNAFLETAYNTTKLLMELENSNSSFFIIYDNDVPAGYLKVNDHGAQTDIQDPLALEVERIYLVNEFIGKGYGRLLMEKAMELARHLEKSYLWLGVWEENEKAINFYQKFDFYPFSKHSFFIGEEEQFDLLLRKDLTC